MLATGGGGRRTCPVCGAAHAACGGPTSTSPVDRLTIQEVFAVGERKKYNAKVNGFDTVLNLTAEEAEKLYPEATPVGSADVSPKARTTQNKARATTENK